MKLYYFYWQAMVDFCAESGWLRATLRLQQLTQMVYQGSWAQSSPLLTLPYMDSSNVRHFKNYPKLSTLPALQYACSKNYNLLANVLRLTLQESEIEEVSFLPFVE